MNRQRNLQIKFPHFSLEKQWKFLITRPIKLEQPVIWGPPYLLWHLFLQPSVQKKDDNQVQ